MANNRIFLVYEPTGRAVCLGKRMAWGWYGVLTDIGEKLQILYDHVREEGSDQDAFRVVTRDEIVSYGEMDPDGLLTLVGLKPRECRESGREDRWSKLSAVDLLKTLQQCMDSQARSISELRDAVSDIRRRFQLDGCARSRTLRR